MLMFLIGCIVGLVVGCILGIMIGYEYAFKKIEEELEVLKDMSQEDYNLLLQQLEIEDCENNCNGNCCHCCHCHEDEDEEDDE